MKRYLLYGVCACLLFGYGCNKDEEEINTPSYADKNWFMVSNKPGELNQLLYQIYKDTGMPIFVNDTLGEENYAVDASGDPIERTELFNLSYILFGTADSQVKDSIPNKRIVQSADTAAMIMAAELIRDRVLPYVPKLGEGRAKCYFLVDSLNMNFTYSVYDYDTWQYVAYTCWIPNTIYTAQKGVVVGDLSDICKMTEEEKDLWCGRIIAAKATSWIMENFDLNEWYNITDDGDFSNSFYNRKLTSFYAEYAYNIVDSAGMFDYYLVLEEFGVKQCYTQEQDVREYIARVYAYRGRENEFLSQYKPDSKVVRKFQLMQQYVAEFEEYWGVS